MTDLPNLTKLLELATDRPFFIGSPQDAGILNPSHLSAGSLKEPVTVAEVMGIPLHCSLDQICDDPRWQEGLANARLLTVAANNFEAMLELLMRFETTNYSLVKARDELLAKIEREAGEK